MTWNDYYERFYDLSLSTQKSYDFCPVCGWGDDPYQIYFPDETGFNPLSLEEARESYKATGDSYAFYCDRNNLPRDEEYTSQG